VSPAYALWFRRIADTILATGLRPDEWQWRVHYLMLRGARWTR
jgi:hypothetical protein